MAGISAALVQAFKTASLLNPPEDMFSSSLGSSSNGETQSFSHTVRRKPARPFRRLRRMFSFLRGRNQHDDDIDLTAIADPEVSIVKDSTKNNKTEDDCSSCTVGCNKECGLWFEPYGEACYWWSFIVGVAVLYNCWVIIYRCSFDEIKPETMQKWFILDYTMDLIYILDILKGLRTAYLDEGVLQTSTQKMRLHYQDSMLFYIDMLCLLPLDLIYLSIGFNSLLRCSRLIKVYRVLRFLDISERHTNYPNLLRILILLHHLCLIFHWKAGVFHLVMGESSTFNNEHFNKNTSTVAMTYVHSLYWSVLSLSTVARLPHPQNPQEYAYTIITMICALLLFAAVMGIVSHIINSMYFAKKEFQAKLDEVKTYMGQSSVPKHLQLKVIRWFDYLWSVKQNINDNDSLALLPDRLKAEISIHCHLDTLKKVDIFQNTEAGFLKELVLRLEPALFSPGDFICRIGEVGKDMYIVKKGRLEVLNIRDEVVANMNAGGYFGEISILNMGDVGNRRTASVKSVGYSDLFCLKKEALWDVLQDYPTARVRLETIAMQRLKCEANQQKQQQTVKPFFQSEPVTTTLGPPSTSAASTSSRTLEALQLPNVKLSTTSSIPSPERKHSFITQEVLLTQSRRSSARSTYSDITKENARKTLDDDELRRTHIMAQIETYHGHDNNSSRSMQSLESAASSSLEPKIKYMSPLTKRHYRTSPTPTDEEIIEETAT